VVVALADKPINAIWIVLFAIVYQQIETYVFTPKVSHRTMEVNPAIALAAVFIGAAIWGPIGAIIGVPIIAVVVSVVETYGRRYELVPALASDPESEPDADERVVDAEAGRRQGHDTKAARTAATTTMTRFSATGGPSTRSTTNRREPCHRRTDRPRSRASPPIQAQPGCRRLNGRTVQDPGMVGFSAGGDPRRGPRCRHPEGWSARSRRHPAPRATQAPRVPFSGCGPSGDSSTMRCSAGAARECAVRSHRGDRGL